MKKIIDDITIINDLNENNKETINIITEKSYNYIVKNRNKYYKEYIIISSQWILQYLLIKNQLIIIN